MILRLFALSIFLILSYIIMVTIAYTPASEIFKVILYFGMPLIFSLYYAVSGKRLLLWLSSFIVVTLISIFIDEIKVAYFQNNKISKKIKTQLAKNGDKKIDFSKVTDLDFEQICIFGPYSNNEVANNTLKFKWDIEDKTSIQSRDDIVVLVFINKGKVSEYTEHPRFSGRFCQFSNKCFKKTNSTFLKEKNSTKWKIKNY